MNYRVKSGSVVGYFRTLALALVFCIENKIKIVVYCGDDVIDVVDGSITCVRRGR